MRTLSQNLSYKTHLAWTLLDPAGYISVVCEMFRMKTLHEKQAIIFLNTLDYLQMIDTHITETNFNGLDGWGSITSRGKIFYSSPQHPD
jgi:hypothetical protein